MSDPLTGIVLAGGRSRRMGQDKAGLPFGGRSLLAWVVRRIEPACRRVIVVARDPAAYPDCGARVIGDRWPDHGPLGGLQAGLRVTDTSYAVVVACDLPFVEPALVAGLAGQAQGWDAVVPHVAGRPQPLCALYHRGMADAAEAILREGGGSLRRLLAGPDVRARSVPEAQVRSWDPALRSFITVNTPEDYERAVTLLATLPRESS